MSTNYCSQCGHEVDTTARFCSSCGAPVEKQGNKGKPDTNQTGPKSKRGTGKPAKSNTVRDTLIVVMLLVVAGLAYTLTKESKEIPKPPEQVAGPAGHDQDISMEMLNQVPNDFPTLVGMGNQFMDEGNFPVAAELYRRALILEEGAHDVRTDYGACLHGMGLPARAIEEFYTVIRTHPEHGIANYNLGIVYKGINELDSARYYWEKYLSMDPNGSAANNARQLLNELGG